MIKTNRTEIYFVINNVLSVLYVHVTYVLESDTVNFELIVWHLQSSFCEGTVVMFIRAL